MRVIGRLGLCVVTLVLALHGTGEAQTEPKNKAVRITNKQSAAARVYINFAADTVLKPTDVPFCEVTGSLNCQFTGVATLCFAVSWQESRSRSTSSKLRPVLIG